MIESDLSYEAVVGKLEDFAWDLMDQIKARSQEFGDELQSKLVFDEEQQTWPYLTLFYIFRTGQHEYGIEYCTPQRIDVQEFGSQIYF